MRCSHQREQDRDQQEGSGNPSGRLLKESFETLVLGKEELPASAYNAEALALALLQNDHDYKRDGEHKLKDYQNRADHCRNPLCIAMPRNTGDNSITRRGH